MLKRVLFAVLIAGMTTSTANANNLVTLCKTKVSTINTQATAYRAMAIKSTLEWRNNCFETGEKLDVCEQRALDEYFVPIARVRLQGQIGALQKRAANSICITKAD